MEAEKQLPESYGNSVLNQILTEYAAMVDSLRFEKIIICL